MSSSVPDAGGNGTGTALRRFLAPALLLMLLAAMALSTTYRDVDAAAPGAEEAFDPKEFGSETYPEVADTIQQDATPLAEVLSAVAADPEQAGQELGRREGTSGAYTYSVEGQGTAGKVQQSLLPLSVPGLPNGTSVSLQVGPAINGTALRDASGVVEFGQFTNQVEYADAATALNSEMREQVLAELDPASLSGKKVSFVGAVQLLSPAVVTITPVSVEVQP
jgi:predicted lipoprotein